MIPNSTLEQTPQMYTHGYTHKMLKIVLFIIVQYLQQPNIHQKWMDKQIAHNGILHNNEKELVLHVIAINELHRPNVDWKKPDTKENTPHNFSCVKFRNKLYRRKQWLDPSLGGDYCLGGVTTDRSMVLKI